MTTAANPSIVDLVKADHAKVTQLFDCAKKSTTDADKQVCMWKIIRELSIHAALEEEVLYPCLKNKFGAEGVKWADKSIAEHLQLKKELYELDSIDADPKNPKTCPLLTNIEKLNNAHIKEEEEQLFPFMQKNCSASGACMVELGKQYLSYKPYMPTRPHPDAPCGSYIGDRVLAAGDYLRDVKRFSGVKDYPIGADPKTLPDVGGAKSSQTAHTK